MRNGQREVSAEEALEAVVRQALLLDDLTAHDVIEQVEALGWGDMVRDVRKQIKKPRGIR